MVRIGYPFKTGCDIDPVIRESQVKKVLVDGGNNINVSFTRTLQALGVSITDLTQSDTPSLASCLPRESTARAHLHVRHLRDPRELSN
jgi:hypothetical protein